MPPKIKMPKLLEESEILQEITNQLATLTTEVAEMKNTIARQNFQLHTLISEKLNKVSEDVANLNANNEAQSTTVSNIIGEQSVLLRNILSSQFSLPKFANKFPLQDEKALNDFENEITEQNKGEMISSLKSIISVSGLKRKLDSILSVDILLNFNVDGVHNKKRLWDYVKFIDILHCAAAKNNDYNRDAFKNDLRIAIKAAKNKYFKAKCLSKKPKKVVGEKSEKLGEDMQNFD